MEKGIVAKNVCIVMKLYHFTNTDTALTKILPYKSLKFNKVKNMNDPVENLLHFTQSDESILNYQDQDFCDAFYMQEYSQIISFSSNEKDDCFKNQNLWSHYGQKNCGICFEIDLEKVLTENKIDSNSEIIHNNVIYTDLELKYLPHKRYGVGKNEQVDLHELSKNRNVNYDKDILKYYLTKNTFWSKEDEYRFIIKSVDEKYLSINDSLSRVYLGVGFSKYYLDLVKKYIPEKDIKVMKLNEFGCLEPFNLPIYQ